MGQAKRRGTFEERKAQCIAKREEQRQIAQKICLSRQAERDAVIDRYTKPRRKSPLLAAYSVAGLGAIISDC